MKFYVEQFTGRGWKRVTADLGSQQIAENMKATLAKRNGESIDNYSTLIEVEDIDI